jgi:hypothetical protein
MGEKIDKSTSIEPELNIRMKILKFIRIIDHGIPKSNWKHEEMYQGLVFIFCIT